MYDAIDNFPVLNNIPVIAINRSN